MVQTLHHEAATRVEGSKANKLCLSMPTVWTADGFVDFCVVWHAKRKDERDHTGPRWECINKVWWYRSPDSKFTTQRTYVEILRFFTRLHKVKEQLLKVNLDLQSRRSIIRFCIEATIKVFKIFKSSSNC